MSDCWDAEVSLVATNLSPDGVWLETALPLHPGDEVLVSLRPPRWTRSQPLVTLARVARVGLHRRRRDGESTGMGLSFVGLGAPDALALSRHLRGLPPPLPGTSHDDPSIRRLPPEQMPSVVLRDGTSVAFAGEGPLLTGGRAPMRPMPAWELRKAS